MQGGVTTALILPGSGNLMGGEAFAIKTRVGESHRVEDMLLNAGLNKSEAWRWMKMACGENPKRVYGSKGIMPESRLGSGWMFRERFDAAKKLKQDQDEWCARSEKNSKFPTDLALESLVALLRGQVKLNVHCYEVYFSIYNFKTYDLEMMVRNSHEFGFNISAFHHALEAWKVPSLLKENNIGAAIFVISSS